MTTTHYYEGHLYQVKNKRNFSIYYDRDICIGKNLLKLSRKDGWTTIKVVKYCLDNGYSGFTRWNNKLFYIRPKHQDIKYMTDKINKIGRRTGHYPIGNFGKPLAFIIVNPDKWVLNERLKEMEEYIKELHRKLGDLVIVDDDSDEKVYESESGEELETIYI